MKSVIVKYTNDVTIGTSVNPDVSDEDIRQYFKVGSIVNVGDGEYDRVEKIVSVNIIEEESTNG
jgi:hypothetical protein